MKKLVYTISLFLLLLVSAQDIVAQVSPIPQDTVPIINLSEISSDTVRGTPRVDTTKLNETVYIKPTYKSSNDSLTAQIDYGSADSSQIDIENKLVHLWGKAYVTYQTIEVQGDYITFDFENNIATAIATYDDEGNLKSKAKFKEGETAFQYDYLKYNFKTKKGYVKQGVTKEGDLFVLGATTKFISKDDSLHMDDIIFNENAVVTSCNLDHPHFGINTKKLKIVPEKLAIIGPSRLQIADIPTPLWLPFGFFPISKGKSSGIIFPDNYDLDAQWGFGLQGLGYYFPINDYMDLKITGDIYLRGSWAANVSSNYRRNYKYSGKYSVIASSRNQEDPERTGYVRIPSYAINWSHREDAKAHPFRSFNASVDIRTNGFTNRNLTDSYSRNQDAISSSVRYDYQFGTSPFSLNAGGQFVQSITQRTVDITFPDATFNMRTIYPFKRKEAVGKEKFYEKINLSYNTKFKNVINATDSTFYKKEAIESAQYAFSHSADLNASFKFLKYFSFNPTINYDEIWFFKEIRQTVNNELVADTLAVSINANGEEVYDIEYTYGVTEIDTLNQFLPFRNLTSRAQVSTKLFLTQQFNNSFFKGIRHVATPSMSINYTPNTARRYRDTIDLDYRDDVYEEFIYDITPRSVFSASPSAEQFNFNFTVGNTIEAKINNRRDSIPKKVKLSNFNYSMNYYAFADSFKLSPFVLNGTTNFFKGKSTLTYGVNLSPFTYVEGEAVDQFFLEDGFNLPLLTNAYVNSTVRVAFRELRSLFSEKSQESTKQTSRSKNTKSNNTITAPQSFLDLFDNFSLNYVLNWGYASNGISSTSGITRHNININGDIQLSEKWKLNLGQIGYDFENKGLTYPDLGFSRDLHCWRMNFSWQPRASSFGGTYRFFVGVASNTLEFIKYNHNQSNSF